MPRVIVCDVNETLLDVGALEPHFKQAFGDGRVSLRSVMSFRVPNAWRIRFASCSSYAMGSCC